MNLFNENNPLHIVLNKIGDIILANLLFIICCIPIVTIGPSLTALYHCTLKMVKGNNSGIAKTFLKAFKENFIQSIIVFLVLIVMSGILIANIYFLQNRMEENILITIFYYGSLGILIVIGMIFLYVFPVIAAFSNTTGKLVQNALFFSIIHIPTTIFTALLVIVPVVLTYLDLELLPFSSFCWFFFGFSTIAYLSSNLLYRIFKKYLESSTEYFE